MDLAVQSVPPPVLPVSRFEVHQAIVRLRLRGVQSA